MRCPPLRDLPPPPAGKKGWPWTEESPALPELAPDGSPWPLISIVTTNYNYGRFLEETLRSVLLQGYPNLEYIVMDGGSTDDSVEIVKRYEPWLSFWASGKDSGQAQGINQGLARCTGEIFNWLNSDDQLRPEALAQVGRAWRLQNPDFLVGESVTVDASSRNVLRKWTPRAPRSVLDFLRFSQEGLGIAQPSAFLRLSLVREAGGLKEDLHYIFDWALCLQLFYARRDQLKAVAIPAPLSLCLSHPAAKMVKEMPQVIEEGKMLLQEILPLLRPAEKRVIKRQVEWSVLLGRVAAAQKQGRPSLLLKLLARHPPLGLSRFYWGAMRRTLWRSQPS